jgi:hypothetical protein
VITLGTLLPDAQRILGGCDRDYNIRRINEAVEILANKGDFDPYMAVVDITALCCGAVPLPPEVETVLAVNICGKPSSGYDQMFNFHLDGPGDMPHSSCCRWSWKDGGESPVFKNPSVIGRLFATAFNVADAGTSLTVYGIDEYSEPLGRIEAGQFVPGILVPILAATPDTVDLTLPRVLRITRVSKPDTRAAVSLFARPSHLPYAPNDDLLAIYRTNWQEPLFRLIELQRKAGWVRVLYRRKIEPLKFDADLIPLHSPAAVLAMLRALKYYDEGQLDTAQGYEATAMRWLNEEQKTRRANLRMPPQVDIPTGLMPFSEQLS